MKMDTDWLAVLREKKVYTAALGTMAATSCDSRGVRYVTLAVGGIKPEGEPFPVWLSSEEEARAAFLGELARFVGDRAEVYFRQQPEHLEEGGKHTMFCRLSAH